MKIYSHYGINDFVICLGYKGYFVKEYFANYFLHMSNVTFDMERNTMEVHQRHAEPWKVRPDRHRRRHHDRRSYPPHPGICGDEDFCCTYGDGLSNIDIKAEIAFHKQHGKLATVAAIQPRAVTVPSTLKIMLSKVSTKNPQAMDPGVNGGFFVLNPALIDNTSPMIQFSLSRSP